jgi:hypothetical protein
MTGVPFNADGNWYWGEPPINGDLASEIEWWLWTDRPGLGNSERQAISDEIEALLRRLFAKPLADEFEDPEASRPRRGQAEIRAREREDQLLKSMER